MVRRKERRKFRGMKKIWPCSWPNSRSSIVEDYLLHCYGDNIFVTLLTIEHIPWCLAPLFACTCEWISANWLVVRMTSEDPQLRKVTPEETEPNRLALCQESSSEKQSTTSLDHSLCLKGLFRRRLGRSLTQKIFIECMPSVTKLGM